MFSVPGMCRWTGYSFHHSCSRAGYCFLQKCSQKGILFSNFCSQTGLQCIFVILCSQTGCRFLPFCSQTGVFKLRKMLPDRVKITAPQRHTPVHIWTKFPPPPRDVSKLQSKAVVFEKIGSVRKISAQSAIATHIIHKVLVLKRNRTLCTYMSR